MKHYILAATLALVAVPGWAMDCKAIGDVAAHIMTERQKGTAMSEMMDWADGNVARIILVGDAYKKPQKVYAENRQEMVVAYRNTVELMCYQGG